MKLSILLNEHRFQYYSNCVNWNHHDVDSDGGLSDMIDMSDEISREQFIQFVGLDNYEEIEKDLGYSRFEFEMKDDWHVKYATSRLHGYRVYYLVHSGIEYVFVPNDYEEPDLF
jgi:hypothetical protein